MFENLRTHDRDRLRGMRFRIDPASVIYERNGDFLFAHHVMLLRRRVDGLPVPVRLRWDHAREAWFWVKGDEGEAPSR